ncbi:MAG: sigma 54-interacting transcriptional regulator [Deltaproteobacteria bacterium]|nr:sigma 54-interacting transcriptional regulator [Deltaproteobacteria bacterium]
MRDSERDLLATVVQQRDAREAHAEIVFTLTVTEGAERGRTFRLDASVPTRTLIGTSPACEIRVTDREVSRRHAALERVGTALKVVDLGSTNGTWIDRVKVFEAELQGGELLRVGATVFQVDVESTHAAPDAFPSVVAFGRVVGASREMRRLYPLTHRLAQAMVPVVIEGETGTGKEALAESIHEMGPRAQGPFVVFDCTAVPPSLVEAELFGHERGAFTGALQGRKGVFEQAHGGTLLIDEVGDLDLSLQPKLLRAIERFEVRRIGGDRWIRVDVRVLAATRRDLDREVQAGRFRDDLFHRLAVARIELPALRNRIGDIAVLATHFWAEMGGDPRSIPRDLMQKWEDYEWPGNVRELKNTIARQLALGDLADLAPERSTPSAPPPAMPSMPSSPSPHDVAQHAQSDDAIDRFVRMGLPFPQARDRILDEFEQRFVAQVLAQHGGDVAKAAAASGIGRRYFQKLKARTKK